MKKGKWVILGGLIILGFGIVFHLQGKAMLGPPTSFMYSNPEWINYGFQIAIVGVIIIGIGSLLGIFGLLK